MMMLIHGPHYTEKTKYVAYKITALAQQNYNLQTKFMTYIGVAAAQRRGSTIHDYLDIGYDTPIWRTKLSP